MDGSQFDSLIRSLAGTRRSLVRGGLAGVAGWLGLAETDARKKRKHKRKTKKPKPNAFGCLEVGDPCRSEADCCSGVCEGKKGKRKCRAHDIGSCDQSRPGYCAESNPYLAACDNGKGVCFRTTAGSNVCAHGFDCADCRRDADCLALGFPAGAVCAPVSVGLCAGICDSGMACFRSNETPPT